MDILDEIRERDGQRIPVGRIVKWIWRLVRERRQRQVASKPRPTTTATNKQS